MRWSKLELKEEDWEKKVYKIDVLEFVDIFSLFCFNYFSLVNLNILLSHILC